MNELIKSISIETIKATDLKPTTAIIAVEPSQQTNLLFDALERAKKALERDNNLTSHPFLNKTLINPIETKQKQLEILKQHLANPDLLQKLNPKLTYWMPNIQIAIENGEAIAIDSNHKVNFRDLSDGTIRLLALVTLLASSEDSLICLHNPEQKIYPLQLGYLAEEIRACKSQTIITTQSWMLANYFTAEELFTIETSPTQTVIKPISKEFAKLKEQGYNVETILTEIL